MSYFKLNAGMPNATKSIGNLTAPSSIAANQRMPCASITHSGLTVNGSGQLVLSANTTFILFGSPLIEDDSPYNADFSCQWYDITNSSWIGRPLISWAGVNVVSTSYMKSAIARAVIYPTASTTVELRIKAVGASLDHVNPVSPGNHWSTHTPYIGTQFYSVLSF